MRRVTVHKPMHPKTNRRSYTQAPRQVRGDVSLSEQISRLKQKPELAQTFQQMQLKAAHMEKKIDEQPQRYECVEDFIIPKQPEVIEIESSELEEALAKAEKNHKLSVYG